MDNINFNDIAPNIAITYFVTRYLLLYLEIETRLPHLYKILKLSWLWALILLVVGDVLSLKFINSNYILLFSLFTSRHLWPSLRNPNQNPLRRPRLRPVSNSPLR